MYSFLNSAPNPNYRQVWVELSVLATFTSSAWLYFPLLRSGLMVSRCVSFRNRRETTLPGLVGDIDTPDLSSPAVCQFAARCLMYCEMWFESCPAFAGRNSLLNSPLLLFVCREFPSLDDRCSAGEMMGRLSRALCGMFCWRNG